MPGARRTRRSRAWCVVNTRVSHHGRAGSPGIPARNGFNGFLRNLPGDRAFLSPSLANFESASLTPASRRQDHTTSPSASMRSRQKRRLRPSHPVPTSVTIAKRPSVGRDKAHFGFDLGARSTMPIATNWHDRQIIRGFAVSIAYSAFAVPHSARERDS